MSTGIAIAGIGVIARHHARSIAEIDGADLVAGSCRTEADGLEFADEFDCTWYADTEEMLDTGDVDVLHVCTPSGAHLEPTRAAAERGIDVLCEKPLEISSERIDAMIAAAREGEICLGGVFNRRYDPSISQLHDAVGDGRFGRISVCNTYVPWWRSDDYYGDSWRGTRELDGGGALMNQSIHGIDIIQWLAGTAIGCKPNVNPVSEVFAYTDTLSHGTDNVEVEDTAVAVLRYRDGTLGQILGATSMYPGSQMRVQVAGRDGTAEVGWDGLITWQFRQERPEDSEIYERLRTDPSRDESLSLTEANHRRNIEAFLDACESGEPFMLDATEARKAVEIIEAIYESAQQGKPVQLG